MPRTQEGVYAVQPYSSRSWAFIADSDDSSPVFDPATMEYLMFGSNPKGCAYPYLQGYIEFKESRNVPFDVQAECQWTALDDDTLSFMLYIHDYFADVFEFGTSPFHHS